MCLTQLSPKKQLNIMKMNINFPAKVQFKPTELNYYTQITTHFQVPVNELLHG